MKVGACTVGAWTTEEVAEVNGVDAGERESGERESGEIESREVAGAKGAKGVVEAKEVVEAKGVTEAKAVAEAKEVEGGRIPREITMRVLRSIAAAKFRHEPAWSSKWCLRWW